VNQPPIDAPIVARKPWFTLGRVLDVLALLVIAFVLWRLFVAPRSLKGADAYPAPRVAYQRLDGGTFTVADAHGKVLFLDFFASWCEPCRLSLPLIERYARAHPSVDVVAIDVGEPRAVALAFARKMHLANVALDPQSLSLGYFGVQGFPTTVVIDPIGKVRAKWSGFNPAIQLAMSHAQSSLEIAR